MLGCFWRPRVWCVTDASHPRRLQIDKDSSVKAKVDSSGVLSAIYSQKIRPQMTLKVSGQVLLPPPPPTSLSLFLVLSLSPPSSRPGTRQESAVASRGFCEYRPLDPWLPGRVEARHAVVWTCGGATCCWRCVAEVTGLAREVKICSIKGCSVKGCSVKGCSRTPGVTREGEGGGGEGHVLWVARGFQFRVGPR